MICLSIYPFVYLFIHYSSYLSICLSIYPFIELDEETEDKLQYLSNLKGT